MKKSLKDKKTKSVKEGLIGGQTKIDVAAPYGKLTSADFKRLRKSKKKLTKEGYSNWREDLIEIEDKIPAKKEKEEKITEKEVNNKIKINPKLELGEALENLGGTLIEMIEIDEVDYIVESVYNELLDEGYDDDEIEEALEYALVEAKVTFGHDTPTGQKKKGNLLKAVGRLARQKLSSKVRGVKSAASGAIASGARQVARGALGVARKMEGDKKPSKVHSKPGVRTSSTYSGAGAGTRERVSSGSYTPPPKPQPKTQTQPKASSQKSPDPWGEPTTPPKATPKQQTTQKPQAKTTTVAAKPQAKTTTVAAKPLSKKQQQAAMRAIRRNPNISKTDLDRITSSVNEVNQKVFNDYWSYVAEEYKEQYEILEKAESEQQQKLFGLALSVKRGQTSRDKVSDKVLEIVDSMSEKKIRDFAKTPHKGLPNKIETKEEAIRQEFIARMVEKIEEQSEVYVDEAKLPSSMKKGKKKLESKTQVIHDVDDNLADQRHPDAAKIDVMRKKSGKWEKVQSLTPSQFAHHKLRKPGEPVKEENDPGDKYGFDQFRDTKKFKETTKPNKPVVRLGDSPRRPAQKSVVTARGGSEFGSKKPSTPMDKPGEFAKDLKSRIGVKNLERKNVHFTGGMRTGSGPEKKAEVVKKIVKPDAKKVIATDDHLQNVRHMAAAASETAPKAKVRAYQSKPATKAKGKVKTGDIVPVRVGKEKDLSDTNIGIRKNTSPSSSTKETQRRRKTAKRGMRSEALDINTQQQNTSQVNQPTSNELNPKQKSALSKLVQSKTMQLTAAKRAVSSGVSPDIS
jgi:hypothetical protein